MSRSNEVAINLAVYIQPGMQQHVTTYMSRACVCISMNCSIFVREKSLDLGSCSLFQYYYFVATYSVKPIQSLSSWVGMTRLQPQMTFFFSV